MSECTIEIPRPVVIKGKDIYIQFEICDESGGFPKATSIPNDEAILPQLEVKDFQGRDLEVGDRYINGVAGKITLTETRVNSMLVLLRGMCKLSTEAALLVATIDAAAAAAKSSKTSKAPTTQPIITQSKGYLFTFFSNYPFNNVVVDFNDFVRKYKFIDRSQLRGDDWKDWDGNCVKCISFLNNLTDVDTTTTTNVNVKIKNLAKTILEAFIAVSTTKEICDLGQLYAIMDDTKSRNKQIGATMNAAGDYDNNGFWVPDLNNPRTNIIIEQAANQFQEAMAGAAAVNCRENLEIWLNETYGTGVNTIPIPQRDVFESSDGMAAMTAGASCTTYTESSLNSDDPLKIGEYYESIGTLPFLYDSAYIAFMVFLFNFISNNPTLEGITPLDYFIQEQIDIMRAIGNIFRCLGKPIDCNDNIPPLIDRILFDCFFSLVQIDLLEDNRIAVEGLRYTRIENFYRQNMMANPKYVFILPEFYNLLSSVYYFYIMTNPTFDNYKDQLIVGLLDALAHDAKDNRKYRLVMAWKIIETNSEVALKKIVELLLNVNIDDLQPPDEASPALMNSLDLLPVELADTTNFITGLTMNFTETQKKIFYLLASKNYKNIQDSMFNIMLSRAVFVLSFIMKPGQFQEGKLKYGIITCAQSIGVKATPFQVLIQNTQPIYTINAISEPVAGLTFLKQIGQNLEIIVDYAAVTCDLPLHTQTTLTGINLPSKTYGTGKTKQTPVTSIDAASQGTDADVDFIFGPVIFYIGDPTKAERKTEGSLIAPKCPKEYKISFNGFLPDTGPALFDAYKRSNKGLEYYFALQDFKFKFKDAYQRLLTFFPGIDKAPTQTTSGAYNLFFLLMKIYSINFSRIDTLVKSSKCFLKNYDGILAPGNLNKYRPLDFNKTDTPETFYTSVLKPLQQIHTKLRTFNEAIEDGKKPGLKSAMEMEVSVPTLTITAAAATGATGATASSATKGKTKATAAPAKATATAPAKATIGVFQNLVNNVMKWISTPLSVGYGFNQTYITPLYDFLYVMTNYFLLDPYQINENCQIVSTKAVTAAPIRKSARGGSILSGGSILKGGGRDAFDDCLPGIPIEEIFGEFGFVNSIYENSLNIKRISTEGQLDRIKAALNLIPYPLEYVASSIGIGISSAMSISSTASQLKSGNFQSNVRGLGRGLGRGLESDSDESDDEGSRSSRSSRSSAISSRFGSASSSRRPDSRRPDSSSDTRDTSSVLGNKRQSGQIISSVQSTPASTPRGSPRGAATSSISSGQLSMSSTPRGNQFNPFYYGTDSQLEEVMNSTRDPNFYDNVSELGDSDFDDSQKTTDSQNTDTPLNKSRRLIRTGTGETTDSMRKAIQTEQDYQGQLKGPPRFGFGLGQGGNKHKFSKKMIMNSIKKLKMGTKRRTNIVKTLKLSTNNQSNHKTRHKH
jgi:hypothetical protein